MADTIFLNEFGIDREPISFAGDCLGSQILKILTFLNHKKEASISSKRNESAIYD